MADALALLRALDFVTGIPEGLSPGYLDWLLLEDSMTTRFEQRCGRVSVRIVREGFITKDDALSEIALLPAARRYWLREIILCGDGEPWLAGRTIVPETTLQGPEQRLQNLGTTPLGRYLFSASSLTRDYIQIGRSAQLWGRRSGLRLAGKPLLLTELFLPASPLYEEEK